MKNTLLFLILLLSAALVSGQPILQILDHGNNDVTGKTITVYNNDHNAALLETHLKVKNNGSSDLNVFVARNNNLVAGSSSNSFCFGVNCYPPFVDTSQTVTNIHAGAVDTSFTGDYYPTGALGVSSVTYYFFDNTAGQFASVTVNFAVAPIEILDAGGNVLNGAVYPILSNDTSTSCTISAKVKILNNSGSDLIMYVHRISNTVVPNTVNSFCYGVCYGPETDSSSIPVMIPNGTIDSTFIADYFPVAHGGTTSLTYEFYDSQAFGNTLAASFTVEFTLKGVGMPEIPSYTFSDAYPNPSNEYTTISYSLPSNVSNENLIIRNLLGVEVQRVVLDLNSGNAVINTSMLPDGVYVYSLMTRGKAVSGKKLIVKH